MSPGRELGKGTVSLNESKAAAAAGERVKVGGGVVGQRGTLWCASSSPLTP